MAAGKSEERRSGRREDVQDVDVSSTDEALRERKEAIDEDVDAILDEIDEVLEENAEEFVRGFVQKGGQ